MKSKTSSIIGIALVICSLICMYLGWTLPFMSLRAQANMLFFSSEIINVTSTIWDTISELFEKKYYLPANLLLFFGLIIPFIKSIGYLFLLFTQKVHSKAAKFFHFLNRWAMADVFSISILISFLVSSSLGGSDVQFFAELKSGFYFFVTYIILGGIASYFVPKASSDKP